MRRDVQNGANLVAALAECGPAQTLEFSCREVRPMLAKYLNDNSTMKPIGNRYQRGFIGC
jgi:hypothetical protein